MTAAAALWITGASNAALPGTIQGRLFLPGLAALACLVAVGWERLRAPMVLQWALPALGLVGTLYAIYDDVWSVYHA